MGGLLFGIRDPTARTIWRFGTTMVGRVDRTAQEIYLGERWGHLCFFRRTFALSMAGLGHTKNEEEEAHLQSKPAGAAVAKGRHEMHESDQALGMKNTGA